MSRAEVREQERFVNTVVVCGLAGLIMALAVATVMVYEESSAHRPPAAGTLHDRGQRHAETSMEEQRQ